MLVIASHRKEQLVLRPRRAFVGAALRSNFAVLAMILCSFACAGHKSKSRAMEKKPESEVRLLTQEWSSSAAQLRDRGAEQNGQVGQRWVMPSLDIDWSPPQLRAGYVQAAIEHAGKHFPPDTKLGVWVEAGLDPHLSRLSSFPGYLQQDLGIDQLPSGQVIALSGQDFEKPWMNEQLSEAGKHLWERLAITWREESLERWRAAGVERAWVIGRSNLALEKWQARPAVVDGSCEPLFSRLGEGQEWALLHLAQSLSSFEETFIEEDNGNEPSRSQARVDLSSGWVQISGVKDSASLPKRVGSSLAMEWERLASLHLFVDALQLLCTARRRVFSKSDLQFIRERVRRLEGLWTGVEAIPREGENRGGWQGKEFRTSKTAADQIRALAQQVENWALYGGHCRTRISGLPWLVALVDVEKGETIAADYAYSEELVCDSLSEKSDQ